MNFKRPRLLMTAVAGLAVLLPFSAQADPISFSLTTPSQSGAPGETLVFQGTLANAGPLTVFLNGDTFTTSTLSLTVDDLPFFLNTPASLGAGVSVGPVTLFRVKIDPGASPGTFPLNFFSLFGGGDPLAQTTLATQQFTVNVSAPQVVPEPATLFLLGIGLAGIAVARKRRNAK